MRYLFILALINFAIFIMMQEPSVLYITLVWLIPLIIILVGSIFTEKESGTFFR
jgi:hypothetical protein